MEQKIDENTRQLKQLRRYFLLTFIVSVAVIVLPLIGLIFAVPRLLDFYQGFGL